MSGQSIISGGPKASFARQIAAIYKAVVACDETPCVSLDAGASVLLDGTGMETGTVVSFPHTSPPGELADWVTPFSISDPDGCLAGVPPETKMRVRVCWECHDVLTGTNGTTGTNVVIGPVGQGTTPSGAMLTAWSPTITSTLNTAGGPNGSFTTTQLGRDKADRWLDFDIPLGELQAGTTVTSSAFGGVPEGMTEYLGNQEIKLLADLSEYGCEVC